ncbi:hypothetical protein C8R43DRAFT_1051402 [Mycena crocata]|nr:hypothetical protein C8R43DRAFT_1051402 [Mycena crocata]
MICEFLEEFQTFCCLESLELCMHAPIAPLLRNSQFMKLCCFKTSVDPYFSDTLRFFINHHPTITSLELLRSSDCLPGFGNPVPELGTLSLPNLTLFSGSGCHAAGLVVANQSLSSLTVVWHADDPSVASAPTALATAVPKDLPVGFKAFCGRGVSRSDVLQGIAEGLPHIVVLYPMGITPGQRISLATAREFAQVFKAFPALCVLKIADVGDTNVYEEVLEEGRRIIKLWVEACRSLWSISLHGHEWSRAETESWSIME